MSWRRGHPSGVRTPVRRDQGVVVSLFHQRREARPLSVELLMDSNLTAKLLLIKRLRATAMELPRRPRGDEYTKPGRYQELQTRVRRGVAGKDVPVLFVNAFDRRTRLGPFVFVDKKLIPGAPIAVASALAAAGFKKTRIALRQWNPDLLPSETRFDGKPVQAAARLEHADPHAAPYDLIEDAYKLGDERPLILAGSARAIYEPWDFFGVGTKTQAYHADGVVTGEEFVLVELLHRLMEFRGKNEHLSEGLPTRLLRPALDDIQGLVFAEGDEKVPLERPDQHRHPAPRAGPGRAAAPRK